ncbi:MAG TPA: winged helix-turn-helix transcriptional regulator [Trueperaceae bacterium]|nr:winged helix-turn-helix transcriptional regulator [Trueperaceae bacterium]
MNSRQNILEHLKRYGPSSTQELIKEIGISENAVRYHLKNLEQDGLIENEIERNKIGRPSKKYMLSIAAEGVFPKRYKELLNLVLTVAEQQGNLKEIMAEVANTIANDLKPNLKDLADKELLVQLLHQLDYGEMLGAMSEHSGSYEIQAYNCLYKDTGCKFVEVCDLLPNVVNKATGLEAERPSCQRDGERACHFIIAKN